jgi:hypothetical protein
MRWAGHAAIMGQMRNACKILIGEGKDHMGHVDTFVIHRPDDGGSKDL